LQSAAIPFRYREIGEVEILLVTSRKKARWIFPKGNVRGAMAPHVSAAKEAFEEGGVIGTPDIEPVAFYQLRQTNPVDETFARVAVYSIAVTLEALVWPEMHERNRRWVSIPTAIDLISNDGMRQALMAFAQTLAVSKAVPLPSDLSDSPLTDAG
jgi:8-oxo-dGTP pyrophosphatase MutT (NUDIX family)